MDLCQKGPVGICSTINIPIVGCVYNFFLLLNCYLYLTLHTNIFRSLTSVLEPDILFQGKVLSPHVGTLHVI